MCGGVRQHLLTVSARVLVVPAHGRDDGERRAGKQLEILGAEFPRQPGALAGCDGRVVEPTVERQLHRSISERVGQDPDFAALPGEHARPLHERTEPRRVAKPERREARPENVERLLGGRPP